MQLHTDGADDTSRRLVNVRLDSVILSSLRNPVFTDLVRLEIYDPRVGLTRPIQVERADPPLTRANQMHERQLAVMLAFHIPLPLIRADHSLDLLLQRGTVLAA